MNVPSRGEGVQQPFIAAEVREDAEFDLRIVRGDEHSILSVRLKPLLHSLRPFAERGKVLEVRFPAAQPSGAGHRGLEDAVNHALPRLAGFRQRLNKTGEHLRELPVLYEEVRHLVEGPTECGKPLQNGDIRRVPRLGLFPGGKADLLEEQPRHLFRGIQVDPLPRRRRNLLLDAGEALRKILFQRAERLRTAGDAVLLHIHKHGDQRNIHGAHQVGQTGILRQLPFHSAVFRKDRRSPLRKRRRFIAGDDRLREVRVLVGVQQVVRRLEIPHSLRRERRRAETGGGFFEVREEHRPLREFAKAAEKGRRFSSGETPIAPCFVEHEKFRGRKMQRVLPLDHREEKHTLRSRYFFRRHLAEPDVLLVFMRFFRRLRQLELRGKALQPEDAALLQ